MAATTISSREFNQNTSAAKKASEAGPVFITDRGHAAHVLLSIEEYQNIVNKGKSILELLAMPGDQDFDFEPARLGDKIFQPVDFK
jgi:PHD/YefM family antitoxin component YafN of YafNO toxin-antitoxin module